MKNISVARVCLSQIDSLKNDVERWKWVLANQDLGFTVYLDNDDTFITFSEKEDIIYSFDGYLGWSDGIKSLLQAVGIKYEEV